MTILILMAVLLPAVAGQEEGRPAKFYRVEFGVKEIEEGKVLNHRVHTMMVSTENPGMGASVRTGSRVPYVPPGGQNQVQYMEVGVNIDCRVTNAKEAAREGNPITLNVKLDISSIATETGGSQPPVLRQTRWSGDVVVGLKKPVLAFSSDDATGKRRMQLEVTATPVN